MFKFIFKNDISNFKNIYVTKVIRHSMTLGFLKLETLWSLKFYLKLLKCFENLILIFVPETEINVFPSVVTSFEIKWVPERTPEVYFIVAAINDFKKMEWKSTGVE